MTRWLRGAFAGASLGLCVRPGPAWAGDADPCLSTPVEGQQLRKSGHLVEARERFATCGQRTCPRQIVDACVRWSAELEAAIPSVVLAARDPHGGDLADAQVSIDGHPPVDVSAKAIELDPGPHSFKFQRAGSAAQERQVILREGEKSRQILVSFEIAAAAPPPAPLPSAPAAPSETPAIPTLALVVGGAGVASLVAGGVFGALTITSWHSATDSCPSHEHCSNAAIQDHDNAVTFGTISDVGFIAGGALVAAGVALYLTAPSRSAPTVGLLALPAGLAVVGTLP